MAEAIRNQNADKEFIKKFSKEIGLPVWRKSPVFYITENLRVAGGSSDTLVFVPLENPGFSHGGQKRISSFIAALVGTDDSVKIRLFRGDRYEGYGKNMSFDTLTSELVAMQCMYLENYVYSDRDTFRINDLSIFLAEGCRRENASRFLTLSEYQGGGQDGRPSVLIVQGTAPACVNISLIEYYEIFGYYPSSSSPNVQVNGQYCIPYQQWVNYIESSNPVPVPVGGGGSGGFWYEENPCLFNREGKSLIVNPCSGNPGLGWIPVTFEDPVYSPYIYDTIGITNSIQYIYPCFYSLLNDSLPNANYIAQLAGSNVFLDSSYIHLTFDTSSTYTQEGQAGAHTVSTNVVVDVNGYSHFYAVIKFNG